MTFLGSSLAASGPGASMRFGPTRGRMTGGNVGALSYPNPFFDVGHTYLPPTMKMLFRWCKYYFLTQSFINVTAFKMAEYPITDVVIDHEDKKTTKQWKDFLEDTLNYRAFQVEVGLDYNTFGNCLISISFPFVKKLKCAACGWEKAAQQCKPDWQYTNNAFRLKCPKCQHKGDAFSHDQYLKSASGIRLVRWNVENVDIETNEITQESSYYYNIPGTLRNDIALNKKDIIATTPKMFLAAIKDNKAVKFGKNLFHLKRATLAEQDRGWGIPLILPVLKDAFMFQVMKKAQETILLEHIIPLRMIYPQAGSGSSDPYTSIDLSGWKESMANEIARWRWDPNYIPIVPLPIGQQMMGGDGKALLLGPEIQQQLENLVVGMGVPKEFIFGGASWAGTNVSLRMIENMFIGYIGRHRSLLRWIIRSVSSYLDWPMVSSRFKPFRMADDIQRQAFNLQLNQIGKLSDTSLLAGSDFSQEDENEIMDTEQASRIATTRKQQVALAEVQGEASLVSAKYQAKAQKVMMEMQMSMQPPQLPQDPNAPQQDPNAPQQGGLPQQVGGLSVQQKMAQGQVNVDIPTMAALQARLIGAMKPELREMAISNLQPPELRDVVRQMLPAMPGSGPSPVDMRPAPELKPPRRQASAFA